MMQRSLILVRHGQSEWNLKNLFTGWKNPALTPEGVEEATRAGELLRERNVRFDSAHASRLIRAQHTCQIILEGVGQSTLKTIFEQSLNERDYGNLTGLNKDKAREKWGDEQIQEWRRSYDIPPPGGESLKDTGARVWPYYLTHILPAVLRGECVLVVAHGNSLRALAMILDRLTKKQVTELNLKTGAPIIYKLDADSTTMSREALE